MKWNAAEPLFSSPLNLTESRWLIQMSRLGLSCQPCPWVGFSLDPLGSRAESPCCDLFKRSTEKMISSQWELSCVAPVLSRWKIWHWHDSKGKLPWVKHSSRQGNCTISFQREREQESEAKMNKRDLQRLFRVGQQNEGGLKKELWWRQQERSQMFGKDHW